MNSSTDAAHDVAIQAKVELELPSPGDIASIRPRLLIFAGPHKTASTSIQSYLLRKGRDFLELHGYFVPAVYQQSQDRHTLSIKAHCMVFNALAERVVENPRVCPIGDKRGVMILDSIREQFQRFQTATSQIGQTATMILATELFDNLVRVGIGYEHVIFHNMHKLLDTGPTCDVSAGQGAIQRHASCTESVSKAVVAYRAPRWQHARSSWYEIERPQGEFLKWVCTWRFPAFPFLLPLQLSQIFLRHNVSVELVDLASATRAKHGLLGSLLTAPEVFNLSDRYITRKMKKSFQLRMNVRSRGRLDEPPLAAQRMIDHVLMEQDCWAGEETRWSGYGDSRAPRLRFTIANRQGQLKASQAALRNMSVLCSSSRAQDVWNNFLRSFC